MSTTHVAAFDKTLQTTNTWLADIQHHFRWDDRQKAYVALRAVLHTLRDCLIVEEAADLGAQLPMLLRGMYYEGWMPSKVPVRMGLEEFLDRVRLHFKDESKIDAEWIVRGAFLILALHVSLGELHDVKHVLSEEIQELWPRSVH